MTMQPAHVIVPILAMRPNGEIAQFLGTGFFVGADGLLMTADHVIRDWEGPLAIACVSDLSRTYAARIVEQDGPHDIALLRVESYRPPSVLTLAFDGPFNSNVPLLALEYGTTKTAGREITLGPATRLGNMTRMMNMEMLGPAGIDALELSFPALRGASGAPVMRSDNYAVWGIVVANVSYHLLPAQIESVLDEDNNIFEEVRYMLPQAAAVNIRHAREMFGRNAVPAA